MRAFGMGLVSLLVVACSDSSSGDLASSGSGSPSASSGGSSGSSGEGSSGTSSGGPSASDGGAVAHDAATGDAASPDAGGAADPCGSALLCETFDTYGAVTNLTDKQKLGAWSAELKTGATMKLDGTHKTSGASALHVHIDNGATAGGRLDLGGAVPILKNKPTHVYGRMRMYIDPNGTSIHWTFFGVNGGAEPTSPVAGKSAGYAMSSLPKNNVNTYSFVYGLSATDGYHDCSSQSSTSMPSSWACVAFEMDSVARKLRMWKDTGASPILAVDDHGTGCVAPTAVTSPWYGPAVDSLYVGAFSFHPMNAPLDVWIDDLVVDTKPVSCPAP